MQKRQLSHALLRKPGPELNEGLTTVDLGIPEYLLALTQHKAYAEAIQSCGLQLQILGHDPRFPDGCFVEDTAIVTEFGAIITRPGAGSRLGETVTIRKQLQHRLPVESLSIPARLDGGDIVRAGNHFFIGLSDRTNEEGARQLANLLENWGFSCSMIRVGEGLHLKSGVSYIGDNRMVLTPGFAEREDFDAYECIVLPEEEGYAANCIQINGKILLSAGYPNTRTVLLNLGYELIELEMSEFRKMDGSLTCLSLLW